jgi:two-component system chemotaxis response regulator CheB
MRVAVIDDSTVALGVIRQGLEAESRIQVVGTAVDGRSGLEMLASTLPEAVVVDLNLPGIDGLQTIQEAHKRWPGLPALVFTGTSEPSEKVDARARAAGALGVVRKPPPLPSMAHAVRYVSEQLVERLLQVRRPAADEGADPSTGLRGAPAMRIQTSAGAGRFAAVVIGASTGGPDAIETVLREIPAGFPVPLVIVQHIGDTVGRGLVDRFAAATKVRVVEARDGDLLQSGTAYIAAPSRHLEVRRSPEGPRLALTHAPAEHFVRPSVDVLFRSAAAVYERHLLAVVLTGMGEDGLGGARLIKALGGVVLAQDRTTSTVWGMPGAVANAGLADQVLPIKDIGPTILLRAAGPLTFRVAMDGGAA